MSFTWDAALSELKRRRELAQGLGGERRIRRQHDQGRLTIRERIERISEGFQEVGEFAAYHEHDATGAKTGTLPSSYVCGLAKVDGRDVALGGEDFTVRGGAPQTYLDRFKGGIGGFVEDMAHEYKIPLLMFMEGIGGDVAAQEEKGHAYLVSSWTWRRGFELMSEVPVLTVVSGAAVGGTAARAVISHFSVITKNSVMFAGGPPLVKRALGIDIDKHELGGATVATASGAIDNLAEDEDDAIRQVRTVLSYLPQNVWSVPPRVECSDPVDRRAEELLTIVPENRRQPYQAAKVIRAIVDDGSFFETGARWGKSVVTGLARMDGIPVGVVASNPRHLGGALDAAAAEKQVRLVDLCNTFSLPILYFVDVPGFMVGPDAERANVMRWGVRAIQSMAMSEVPVVTIQVRKAYGLAASATSVPDRLGLRIAWPTGEWGDLPVEGGVEAAYSRQIAEAEDPAQMRADIESRLTELVDPWRTAEAFGVELMIDPRETREVVSRFLNASWHAVVANVGQSRRIWSMRP